MIIFLLGFRCADASDLLYDFARCSFDHFEECVGALHGVRFRCAIWIDDRTVGRVWTTRVKLMIYKANSRVRKRSFRCCTNFEPTGTVCRSQTRPGDKYVKVCEMI